VAVVPAQIAQVGLTYCTYSIVTMCMVHLSETMDVPQPQYTAWGLSDASDSTKYD